MSKRFSLDSSEFTYLTVKYNPKLSTSYCEVQAL